MLTIEDARSIMEAVRELRRPEPEEWPEERVQALVVRYEETDQLALQEALNQKQEWD